MRATAKSTATPIKDLIGRVIAKIDREKTIDQDTINAVWNKAVGEGGAKHAKPVSLHRGTLRVRVENPGWIQELTFRKRKILKELQRHFGKDQITDIRFKIGEPRS